VTLTAVPYRPERRADLFALMEAVWGEEPDGEAFDWLFDRTPVRPGLVTLVEDEGEVAGVGALSWFRAKVEGEEQPVSAAVWMATHPGHRGKGVFQFVELENERIAAQQGDRLVLGFTNPEAGPIYVAKLDWVDVFRPRLWARLLRPVAAVKGVLGKATPTDTALPLPRGGRRFERFGRRHEELYRGASASWPSHVVRTADYLNWRFADARKEYRLLEHDGGYAVVGHSIYHGVSAGYLADLVATGPRAAFGLLRAAVAEARGAADIVVAIPPPGLRGVFAAAGFAPTHLTLRVIGKSLVPGAAVPDDWYFALGDTDIF
jgi:GNAT superfamily N-acetyltransferase